MTQAARIQASDSSARLTAPQIITLLILPLTALASGVGLFWPEVYRDNAWIVPQNQGQDLITLAVAVPALALTLIGVGRGSARAQAIWLGLLGYICYTYTGATVAFAFNRLFLVYVALFSLSVFGLVSAAASIDVARVARSFGAGVPRRSVSIFLGVIGLLLTVLWLGQTVPPMIQGTVPESVKLAESPTMFVYGLDLGIIVPLAFLAAYWLWRREAWGYLLAGVVLIKAAAMGVALLSMTWFSAQAGLEIHMELVASYLLIAVGGVAMSVWFFRHCSD